PGHPRLARPGAGRRRRAPLRAPDLHGADRAPHPARETRPRDGVLAMTARLGTGRHTRDPAGGDPVAWHDAEHGGFAADLELFARLAGELPGGVLDLGAGTGRVALPLRAGGHPETALAHDSPQ